MNYDLAIMALEGLSKSPVDVRITESEIVVTGSPASFKEMARLFLLLGGAHMEGDFELQPGVHVSKESLRLRLTVTR
jgi:hypothetical protein